jgi:N-dimethylarginine dimethylaminohydrolase
MNASFHEQQHGNGTVLMCPPSYYAVEYEINPWMDTRRKADKARSRQQWNALYGILTGKMGLTVETILPLPGLPDLVFTANAGLVMGTKAILSRFRHPERGREEPYWQVWFETNSYTLYHLPPSLHFEGEGDMLLHGDALVAGYRFRSDREAVHRVGELLRRDVMALELADPWFYHLDTCLCPVNQETALYFPGAFTHQGHKDLLERFTDPVPVTWKEAQRFACNSVVAGNHVVMSTGCPDARRALETRGYDVHEVDVNEFLKAGGGAKCLVLFLDRVTAPGQPAVLERAAA